MLAAHYKLDNLCVIIDNNSLLIDGEVAKMMSPYPIVEKLVALGFLIAKIEGSSFDEMDMRLRSSARWKARRFQLL